MFVDQSKELIEANDKLQKELFAKEQQVKAINGDLAKLKDNYDKKVELIKSKLSKSKANSNQSQNKGSIINVSIYF